MTLHISSVFTYDEDAGNYIQAVETADGQALESATRQAINNFVIGCKQDGIWTAIKASCILAGARTLAGALVPLAGTAPTNNNFVAGDYNRETGLKGNGSSKYLNTNRSTTDDPTNNAHISGYVTQGSLSVNARTVIGAYTGSSNSTYIGTDQGPSYQFFARSSKVTVGNISSTGLIAVARDLSNQIVTRIDGASVVHANQESGNAARNYGVLGNLNQLYGDQRVAFYSIGESLDLAKLDGRVTDLITAFGAAIP